MRKISTLKFFLGIVLPSLAAILLFVTSFYFLFLPAVESAMVNGKRELIAEQTNTVWSLVSEYQQEHTEGELTREQAQAKALERISRIRYGDDKKGYFWIVNKEPRMLMHPYRPELENANLSDYRDPNGKPVFVTAVTTVNEQNEGFVDYMWQWKDNPDRVGPKLSYVKGFEPWGWIIGTGIYLDDVEQEVHQLKADLLQVTLTVTVVIAFVLLFVIRQSLIIEQKRLLATEALIASKRKYKTLVEASNQGILMFLGRKLIFSNAVFKALSGYDGDAVKNKQLSELLTLSWSELDDLLEQGEGSQSLETALFCANNEKLPVIMYASKVTHGGEQGVVVSLKELSGKVALASENAKVAEDIQSSLLLMERVIRPYIKEILTCDAESTIAEAASLLSRKGESCLFITKGDTILGIVTESDFLHRVLATQYDAQAPVTDIMSAPVAGINESAFIYEALLAFDANKVAFLATRDHHKVVTGVVSHRDLSLVQHNTVSYLLREIGSAEQVSDLARLHNKVPSLALALVESGDKAENITHIVSGLSDAFSQRIITLGLEKFGSPPCEFAFIAMGSEGRCEQTLSTDQDNAIIYADVNAELQAQTSEYFLKLGDFIAYSLNEIGYNYCKGGIMACNKKWNRPLSQWRTYFEQWMNSVELADVVEANVFFDFRCVYGNSDITDALRSEVAELAKGKTVFLSALADAVSNYKSPLGAFGKIVGNNIEARNALVDIKMALVPLVKFARLHSLAEGIRETHTLNRIKQLYNKNLLDQQDFDSLIYCYNYLMQMRFRVQAQSLLSGEAPTNTVDTSSLTDIELTTLVKIFTVIDDLSSRVTREFAKQR